MAGFGNEGMYLECFSQAPMCEDENRAPVSTGLLSRGADSSLGP